MATVPLAWRTANSWGPAGNEARAQGTLKPLFYPSRAAEWRAFARHTLRDGDVLFRYGYPTGWLDRLTMQVVTGVSKGRFTHDSIAHWVGDTLYLYDVEPEPEAVRHIPFEFWMLDTAGDSLVVKRLRPPYRHCIPQALAYCEAAYRAQVPFDEALAGDDEHLYCSELVEKAFRSAGLALSDPVPIRDLPNYALYRPLSPLVESFTDVRVDTPIFALGNEDYGTFGSPYLETVYDGGKQPASGGEAR